MKNPDKAAREGLKEQAQIQEQEQIAEQEDAALRSRRCIAAT